MSKSSLLGWTAAFAGVAAMSFASSSATAQTGERTTANAVSLNPEDANSYRSFAPELKKTLARVPQLDPETQLYVSAEAKIHYGHRYHHAR